MVNLYEEEYVAGEDVLDIPTHTFCSRLHRSDEPCLKRVAIAMLRECQGGSILFSRKDLEKEDFPFIDSDMVAELNILDLIEEGLIELIFRDLR